MIIDKRDIIKLTLEAADIGAVKGGGPFGYANRAVFTPCTDRLHHFLVWKRSLDDFIILESVGKGLAIGRLSMYDGQDVRFYRADTLELERREMACEELTRYGRSHYDWALYLRLLKNVAQAELVIARNERRLRKIHAYELPCREDGWLVCTEAVVLAFRLISWDLVPKGVTGLPSAIEQARLDGLIREVE